MKNLSKYLFFISVVALITSCSGYHQISENDVYMERPTAYNPNVSESDIASYNAYKALEDGEYESNYQGDYKNNSTKNITNNFRIVVGPSFGYGYGYNYFRSPFYYNWYYRDPFYYHSFFYRPFGFHGYYSSFYGNPWGYGHGIFAYSNNPYYPYNNYYYGYGSPYSYLYGFNYPDCYYNYNGCNGYGGYGGWSGMSAYQGNSNGLGNGHVMYGTRKGFNRISSNRASQWNNGSGISQSVVVKSSGSKTPVIATSDISYAPINKKQFTEIKKQAAKNTFSPSVIEERKVQRKIASSYTSITPSSTNSTSRPSRNLEKSTFNKNSISSHPNRATNGAINSSINRPMNRTKERMSFSNRSIPTPTYTPSRRVRSNLSSPSRNIQTSHTNRSRPNFNSSRSRSSFNRRSTPSISRQRSIGSSRSSSSSRSVGSSHSTHRRSSSSFSRRR